MSRKSCKTSLRWSTASVEPINSQSAMNLCVRSPPNQQAAYVRKYELKPSVSRSLSEKASDRDQSAPGLLYGDDDISMKH
ncbi:uncharacterized protein N7473_002321 [Penicillium subrubescens]|uniref:uncharacterized protein n=1 Tax=Penicillium subrubescens TaxID=1316194 RepID=UPI0025453089|nr:uncharacterized protein N7473_002321 [Penicillium subrubescens]KAJ5905405.1 hypothetical protein N7473_002321 [Penicillium subrubescens]